MSSSFYLGNHKSDSEISDKFTSSLDPHVARACHDDDDDEERDICCPTKSLNSCIGFHLTTYVENSRSTWFGSIKNIHILFCWSHFKSLTIILHKAMLHTIVVIDVSQNGPNSYISWSRTHIQSGHLLCVTSRIS